MSESTDPAMELWQVFTRMQAHPGKGTCRDALADMFGCAADDEVFFVLLAAISTRCDRLNRLVDTAPELAEHREEIAKATRTLRHIFGTDILPTPWKERSVQFLRPECLTAVKMASIGLRSRYPLKKLSDDERTELLRQINDVLADAESEHSFSALVVRNALIGIRTIIERLDFFGHDALIERLFLANGELYAPSRANEKERGQTRLRKKALAVVCAVVGALIVSDEALTAVENHYHRAQCLLEYIHQNGTAQIAEVKKLPPPSKTGTDAVET